MTQAQRIAQVNDQFRRQLDTEAGRVFITSGVNARGLPFVARTLRRVAEFDAFTERNNPHGEHDFGSIDAEGVRVFWKIDYYGKTLDVGSDDPSDPAKTTRVLTVMLAEEY